MQKFNTKSSRSSVYVPGNVDPRKRLPVVFWIHGGGWAMWFFRVRIYWRCRLHLDRRKHGDFWRIWLDARFLPRCCCRDNSIQARNVWYALRPPLRARYCKWCFRFFGWIGDEATWRSKRRTLYEEQFSHHSYVLTFHSGPAIRTEMGSKPRA